jgi:hypothetical protein
MDATRPWLSLLSDLYRPPSPEEQRRLNEAYGDLLVDLGLADRAHVNACLAAPVEKGRPFPPLTTLLIKRGVLTREQLAGSVVAAAAEDPGNRVGAYILVSPLREGTWKAWDCARRDWAQLLYVDPEEQALLKPRAKVEHPGLVKLRDSGEVNGRAYVVFDFIQGVTLATLPRSNRRRLMEAIRDAALAVAALHRKKLTHGAVSINTLLIDETNTTRLTGWGDGKDDVRDLAAALYELLSDRPAPASGPPKAWPKRFDAGLRTLFEKALGKRPPSAAAFAESLTRLLQKP